MAMSVTPFTIRVADDVLRDLRMRLARSRLPDAVSGAAWDYGADRGYLAQLLAYYREQFDWRVQEARLNQLAHYCAEVEGYRLHFVHQRGEAERAVPLLLVHGFPDSFLRMEKLIPRLTHPSRYGGDARDAFDVIVPSIPGYGFSERPRERGMGPTQVARLFGKLLREQLGYSRYGVHGGDWGSVIAEQLARLHPEDTLGLHLTEVPFTHLHRAPPESLSEAERAYIAAGRRWQAAEGGYYAIQASKPQTLAFALNDSPSGLTAWIVEKFRSWSDCGGDVEARFSKDELLTNVTLYWVTETIHSAMRLYYEAQGERARAVPARLAVPTGFAIFPRDLLRAPREFGERWFDVQRWSNMERGGHFAAFEEPDLLAHELRAFYRPLRSHQVVG